MSKIDIVIVNWNSGDFLRNCIESIVKNDSGNISSVVVVDNGSMDGSQYLSTQESINVQLIELEENIGFSRACNLGSNYCKSEFLLFLNPDTLIIEKTFCQVINFLDRDENSNVGVLGIKSIGSDNVTNRHCARIPNSFTIFFELTGLSTLSYIYFPPTPLIDFDHETSCYVDHVIGAFYLVRAELFQKLGRFDERYFVYMEDIDFSSKVKNSGNQIYYMATVSLFHQCGGSSKNVKAARLYYSISSKLKYSKKWFSFSGHILVLMATFFVHPVVRLLYILSRNKFSSVRDLFLCYQKLIADILT